MPWHEQLMVWIVIKILQFLDWLLTLYTKIFKKEVVFKDGERSGTSDSLDPRATK